MPSSQSVISLSSTSGSLFYLLPPELRLQIYGLVNKDQGQLRHDYRSPALIVALQGIKGDKTLYHEALTDYLRINAHITMKNEGFFLNKPKDEIERIKNLHITWGDRA